MNRIEGVIEQLKKNWYSLLYVFSFLLYAVSVVTIEFNTDAGYFLHLTQLIARGYQPFVDFAPAYPILTFYLLLPVKLLLGKYFTYKVALVILHCFTFANTVLVFRICALFAVNRLVAQMVAIFFLIATFLCEGHFYILEPYVVFFGLSAVYVYLKHSERFIMIVLAGISVALSFFAKQYGLGYFPLLILLVVMHNERNYKKTIVHLVAVMIGFIGCVVAYVALFRHVAGGYQFLDTFTSQGYNRRTFTGLVQMALFAIQLSPCVFFAPVVWKYCERHQKKLLLFSIFGLVGFSGALWFGTFKHYLILVLPFISILTALILDIFRVKNERLFLVLASIPVSFMIGGILEIGFFTCMPNVLAHFAPVNSIKAKNSIRDTTLRDVLIERIGHNNKILIVMGETMPPYMYFKADLLPAGLLKRGVGFGFEGHNVGYLVQKADDAHYVCISVDEYKAFSKKAEFNSFTALLNQNFAQPEIVLGRYYLFCRK